MGKKSQKLSTKKEKGKKEKEKPGKNSETNEADFVQTESLLIDPRGERE